jgi:hypothetical protein
MMKTPAPSLPPLRSGATGFTCPETNRFICTGSRMGRHDTLPALTQRGESCKLRLVKLALIGGDYDSGGAYWGRSPSAGDIYRAIGDCGDTRAELFVRARNRAEAKTLVCNKLPAARFYR